MSPILTIAQLPMASPEPLPDSSGLSHWLLEQSSLSAIVLAVIGLLVMLALARRGEGKRAAITGAIALTAAAVIGVVGALVVTDAEHIRAGTRELVRAACEGDAGAVVALLTPDVQVRIGAQRLPGDGRDILTQATEALQSTITLRECAVEDLQATIDGANAARTQVNVRAVVGGAGPNFTWWKLDWRKEADGQWRIWGLECLLLNGRRPSAELLRVFN